jgi:hypothetical protein
MNFQTTQFAKHDETGRILFVGQVPGTMLELQGENVVAGNADAKLDYVLDGAITRRPANTAVLDGMTLKSLPAPCVITVEGVEHSCSDDTAELSFSHAGTYTVTVTAFPMLDATFEVTQA